MMSIAFRERGIETDLPGCPLNAARDPEPAARPAARAGITLPRKPGLDA